MFKIFIVLNYTKSKLIKVMDEFLCVANPWSWEFTGWDLLNIMPFLTGILHNHFYYLCLKLLDKCLQSSHECRIHCWM